MDNMNCKQKTPTLEFSVNILVHIIFLFTVLSVLFIFIITKMSSKLINSELKELLDEALEKDIKISDELKVRLNFLINKNNLTNISDIYKEEEKARKYNNKTLIKSIYITLITLVLVLLFAILATKLLCHKLPLKHIFTENIIIFTGIAIVEFIFFKYIILKYIPVEPSYIETQLLDSVNNKL